MMDLLTIVGYILGICIMMASLTGCLLYIQSFLYDVSIWKQCRSVYDER